MQNMTIILLIKIKHRKNHSGFLKKLMSKLSRPINKQRKPEDILPILNIIYITNSLLMHFQSLKINNTFRHKC